MIIETVPNKTEIMITLPKRFDFSLSNAFQDSYEPALHSRAFKSICLNMSAVEFIDGAALGMLIALKRKSYDSHIDLHFAHCPDPIASLLEAAGINEIPDLQYYHFAEGQPQTISEFFGP